MASGDEILLKQVKTVIEREPRVNLHSTSLQVHENNGVLTLTGNVKNIAAKRLAVRLLKEIDGVGQVLDQIQVVPQKGGGDDEILMLFCQSLLRQTDLKNCIIRRISQGQVETIQEAVGALGNDEVEFYKSGEIECSVEDGKICLRGRVISLSHLRIIEVLAWWTPGCRNVVNELVVMPSESDNDDEIRDAVRLVLEMDPLLTHVDEIGIVINHGVVRLEGISRSEEEIRMAESDAWYIPGVTEVENRLQIRR